VERRLTEAGWFAGAYRMDVRDREEVDSSIAEIAYDFADGRRPRIDVIVNNAGITGYTPVEDDDDTIWQDIMDTNLTGTMRVTRAALPYVQPGGRIIAIASVVGKVGAPGYSAYSASKHGILGYIRSLALELAPRRVTANAVCPGWVDTDQSVSGLAEIAARAGVRPAMVKRRIEGGIPIGRFIEADEVADLVLFLARPEAAAITGQAVSICGGQTQA
jgi:ketoreductase